MQWALLAIIIVALFLLSGRYPRVAFGILGVLVVAAIAILLLTENNATLKHDRIVPADISVENIAGQPAYGGGYRLTGRIKNANETLELKEAMLSIVMEDCVENACEAVGQTSQRVNVRVPPGQARDFSITVYLGETRLSGTIRWSFDVTDTRS